MKKNAQILLKEDYENLIADFNTVLKKRGYTDVEIKHFSLININNIRTKKGKKCLEWKIVCDPINLKCYKRCVKYKEDIA